MTQSSGERTERAVTIPEVSADGLEEVLNEAARHVSDAAKLRVEAAQLRDSDDFRVASRGILKSRQANERVTTALYLTEALDKVLPLPDGYTWQTEISARAKIAYESAQANDIASQAPEPAQN